MTFHVNSLYFLYYSSTMIENDSRQSVHKFAQAHLDASSQAKGTKFTSFLAYMRKERSGHSTLGL